MSGNNDKKMEDSKVEKIGDVGGAGETDQATQVQTPQPKTLLTPNQLTILPPLPSKFPPIIKRTTGPWPEQIPNAITIYIDKLNTLTLFLYALEKLQSGEAQIFLDAEGSNHGWNGTLSTLQATLAHHQDTTYILDVLALGQTLFTHPYGKPPNTFTFKDILENAAIPKFWFDCRADSAALAGQFGIKMRGVCDMQVLHIGYKIITRAQGPWLSGLADCMVSHLTLVWGSVEHGSWMKTKEAGKTEMRGQYERWLQRPLPPLLLSYAAGDTKFMPLLYAVIRQELVSVKEGFKLWDELIQLLGYETEKRILDSFVKDFETTRGMVSQAVLDFVEKCKEADLASGAISVINYPGVAVPGSSST